jgi:hypothetical protein
MEESDIYIVDTRNADHRTHHSSTPWRPGTPARPVQTVYAQPSRVYTQAQPQVIYAQSPQSMMASNIFGKVTPGQLVDLVAQIFAALMPLPAAPVATDSAATDVGNLILYQSALASYAKRDEQVRTLGNLVTKLLG